eukprot:TRINITY_DN678_c0_g1_i1.p1 TRINITY_DN678_c0_g1~~TRINITY_DN678_c0_g1_i1.p1  ORF type:complete len:353 (-),score=81.76 TRINITY_DN678_c0_g1_i1:282-1340(-)
MTRQFQVTIPEDRSIEIFQYLHDKLNIKNLMKIHSGNMFIIIFRISNEKSNEVLASLQDQGVGRDYGYIDILPIETTSPLLKEKKGNSSSITDRLTLEAIYSSVDSNNNLSFDFLVLLVVASIIAAAGLASNNAVVVVASMLVSPLMGPILAFSLGGLINEWAMVLKGLLNEAIALFICIMVGFIITFLFLPFGDHLDWPTNEMASRGIYESLLFGLLVASPSGIGVAISLTSSNVASLVGVAISASLLPPAVNAGMLLNYAFFGPFFSDDAKLLPLLIMSSISFSLCILNIVCINIFAMLFFKIKKIVPLKGASDQFKNFQKVQLDPTDLHELYHVDDEEINEIVDELDES